MILSKFKLCLLFVLLCGCAFAQSSFRKLSRPEKCWVFFHPFRAIKARKVTQQVMKDVDSVKLSGVIGTDGNGGKLDAFRHAWWMACLTNSIGARNARKLGEAHEKGNYRQFRKHQLEDSALPDSVSSLMDLANNEQGIIYALQCKECPRFIMKKRLIDFIKEGTSMYTIKKDENGNYLSCDGSMISQKEWKGKWNIPKCLVVPPVILVPPN